MSEWMSSGAVDNVLELTSCPAEAGSLLGTQIFWEDLPSTRNPRGRLILNRHGDMDLTALANFFFLKEKHPISEELSEDENQAVEIWFCSYVRPLHVWRRA